MKGLKEYEEMFEMIFLQLTIYWSFTLSFIKIIQNFNNIHLDEISLQTETNTVFLQTMTDSKKVWLLLPLHSMRWSSNY